MDNIYIQYLFIVFLVGFAVWYLFGMVKNIFKKDKDQCGASCGCSPKITKNKKN